MPNTPSGGREHEQFTTYEAHRTNFIVRVCSTAVVVGENRYNRSIFFKIVFSSEIKIFSGGGNGHKNFNLSPCVMEPSVHPTVHWK